MVQNYEDVLNNTERLQSERIYLRRYTLNDASDVLEYGNDARTVKYLVWEGISTIQEAETAISQHFLRPGVWAIELNENKKCIGGIDIRLEPRHEKATVGYVLNRAYWGQGYMTEALQAVIAFCFDTLQLNRIEATHYVGNEASGRVMQKCGMQYEGTAAKEVKIKGVFHDVVHYGLLNPN